MTTTHTHTAYGFTSFSRWLGRCPSCKATVKHEVAATAPINACWHIDHKLTRPCECGAATVVKLVVGRESGRTCDARCMNAKGPDCECACGGKNHGAG